MYKIAKNLSPFTLGLVFCCSQAALLPAARAASLNPNSSGEATLPSNSNTTNQVLLNPTAASSSTVLPAGVSSVDCPLQSGLGSSQGSAAQSEPTLPKNSGITPVPKNSGDKSLKYQSNEIASSDVPSTEPVSKMQDATTSPTLIAQAAVGDCCGIGGAATCEVGGLPTGGAGLGGLSPLLGLLGILPAAALIPALDDGGNGDPGQPGPGPVPVAPVPVAPVPESSSTGAIVAGFGMMGLLLSRRYRSGRKNKNVNPE
jgi:hypothetical protein